MKAGVILDSPLLHLRARVILHGDLTVVVSSVLPCRSQHYGRVEGGPGQPATGCYPPLHPALSQSNPGSHMMSSEEESEGFGLYNDKLSKKAKRSRQRVDAGEPRNSYSSIPNFSSRPNFINSGIYGAFFSQNQQHFGFFGQGFGPNKMLNELLGRQVKTGSEANIPADNMMTMDPNSADVNNYEAQVLRRGLDEDVSPPPGDIVAHHMLRDILQGRKKDLLALEHEFRGVNTNGTGPNSPDNNNCINNNNNNELKNTNITNGLDKNDSGNHMINGDSDANEIQNDVDNLSNPEENQNNVSDKINSLDEENMNDGEASDSEHSVRSSSSDIKKELDDPDMKDSNSNDKSDQVELKRARVENIVSTMRSSPSLPTQVNGCKKRKLYHPQQHDNSLSERYASLNNNNISPNMNMLLEEDEDEDLGPEGIRQKVVEKNALKNQLRSMQEQLAAMQQKYVRLCTKMETEPAEPQEVEDISSDVEEQDNNNVPVKPEVSTPATTPVKETPSTPNSTPVSQPVMSPAISKMISAKLHQQQQNGPHMNHHGLPLPPNFNGALSLLQQQVLQEQHPQGIPMPPHHPHHPHHPAMGPHALSNAAAMYLGVRFMEQEARMAKEAAMVAEHHQQQQRNAGEHHSGLSSQNHPQRNQNEPINPPQPRQSPHPNVNHKNEFNERLSMLRNSALHPIAGPVDLENLADVLKSEITSSLSNLIDAIIARFIQQKRMMGKQSEASAAAEQLNKDLLLASQLLDRKSQRTKVIDRGNNGASSERERSSSNSSNQREPPRMNTAAFPTLPIPPHHPNNNNPENNINTMNLPQIRPSPMFQQPKTPTSSMNSAAAAAAAAAIYSMGGIPHPNPFQERDVREERERNAPEQNEALSLVVQPKKKRHKVTDTRITPRTVSRILAQDNMRGPTPPSALDLNKFNLNNLMNHHSSNSSSNNMNSSQLNGTPMNSNQNSNTGSESPQRPTYHNAPPPPPPMLPVSLPTSVAIPNPSLHESQVFSPYSPFYNAHMAQNPHHLGASSPPGFNDLRDSPPLPPHPTMLHPALLAAAHGGSPDFNMRGGGDSMDMVSDEFGNEAYDGMSPTISFINN